MYRFFVVFILVLVGATEGKHIVVIGGGVAGLTAACELRQLGHDVTIMEKNPTLGGRATILSEQGS